MNFGEYIIRFIYPPVCAICLNEADRYLCSKCRKWVNFKSKNNVDVYRNKSYKKHLYIFEYEGIIRKRILEYKFKNKSYLSYGLAETILCNKKNISFIKEYDYLLPVPMHKSRIKTRGYNQSELIAECIARKVNCKLLKRDILIKSKNIVAQSSLDKNKRMENIKNAFCVKNSKMIQGKKILLLDDIYTTGSTVNECSRILSEAGAKEIGVLTIAKD